MCVSVCRYLFALQIKQDLSNGSLTCHDNSAALLVSHILQCKYSLQDILEVLLLLQCNVQHQTHSIRKTPCVSAITTPLRKTVLGLFILGLFTCRYCFKGHVFMYVCVAAELGDYDEELDCHHLEMKQYVPNQEYLDHKIIKFHKKHRLMKEKKGSS